MRFMARGGAGMLGWLWGRGRWPLGAAEAQQAGRAVETVPGMPPVVDPANLYSETRAGKLSPAVAGALPRVYVPNVKSQRRLRDRSRPP